MFVILLWSDVFRVETLITEMCWEFSSKNFSRRKKLCGQINANERLYILESNFMILKTFLKVDSVFEDVWSSNNTPPTTKAHSMRTLKWFHLNIQILKEALYSILFNANAFAPLSISIIQFSISILSSKQMKWHQNYASFNRGNIHQLDKMIIIFVKKILFRWQKVKRWRALMCQSSLWNGLRETLWPAASIVTWYVHKRWKDGSANQMLLHLKLSRWNCCFSVVRNN